MAFENVYIQSKRNGAIPINGYRQDIAIGETISLQLTDNTGISAFQWELVGRPEGSVAGGVGPEPILLGTSATASFVVDNDAPFKKDGMYVVHCLVNAGAPSEARIRAGLVRVTGITTNDGRVLRKLGGFEVDEDTSVVNTKQGWATMMNRWLQRLTEAIGGAVAAPPDRAVQFNDTGAFAGNVKLRFFFDPTNGAPYTTRYLEVGEAGDGNGNATVYTNGTIHLRTGAGATNPALVIHQQIGHGGAQIYLIGDDAAISFSKVNGDYPPPAIGGRFGYGGLNNTVFSNALFADYEKADNWRGFIVGSQAAVGPATRVGIVVSSAQAIALPGGARDYVGIYADIQSSPALNYPVEPLCVANNFFRVNTSGDIVRVRNIPYSWPAAQGAALTFLQNDGIGNLSWSSVAGSTVPGGASGAVQFNQAGSFGGNTTNFFWDAVNLRLALLNNAPTVTFSIGATEQFRVASTGDLTRIRDIPYSWPALQGAANTFLRNDGAGALSWVAGGVTAPGGATGAVQFNTAGAFDGDTSNLFWDNPNNRLGILNSTPSASLSIGATEQFRVSSIGDLVRIRDVPYSWPSAQGAATTVLQNNGSGTLSWSSVGSSNPSLVEQLRADALTQTGLLAVDNAEFFWDFESLDFFTDTNSLIAVVDQGGGVIAPPNNGGFSKTADTLVKSGGKFFVACRFKFTGAPGNSSSLDVSLIGQAGQLLKIGVEGAGTAGGSNTKYAYRDATNGVTLSTINIDTAYHKGRFWWDGTDLKFSVDSETPILGPDPVSDIFKAGIRCEFAASAIYRVDWMYILTERS